jgi:hypothetical protein
MVEKSESMTDPGRAKRRRAANLLLDDGAGFGDISVKGFDGVVILLFDDAALELHGEGQRAVVEGEVAWEQRKAFDRFELSQMGGEALNLGMHQSAREGMGCDFLSRRDGNSLLGGLGETVLQLGTIRATTNLRRSPTTIALVMYGLVFSEFSMGCGAMNFPADVLIKSFLRSVMKR